MTYWTHIMGGAVAGSIIVMSSDVSQTEDMLIMSGAIVGSLLPDIDHRQSKISRSSAVASLTSFITSIFSKHRGALHTLFFIMIIYIASIFITLWMPMQFQTAGKLIFAGLIPGMWSHIVLDTLNPGGIMWLYPLKKKYIHILKIRTGSLLEIAGASILAVLLYILVYKGGMLNGM